MRLICLSERPNKPCYVLSFKGVTLMLDCALDSLTTLNFLPIPLVHSSKLSQLPKFVSTDASIVDHLIDGELRECTVQGQVFVDSSVEFGVPDFGAVDFSTIDVILISNYTNMLALPYITEETEFRGMVYATEPTLNFARIFMEETIELIERTATSRRAHRSGWKNILKNLPPPLSNANNPKAWRTIYSREQLESSFSKVTLVGFSEEKSIFGLITVTPVSSGLCIGSSNWIISSGFEKIAYVSGSSTLTTHPKSISTPPLKNLDCLIMTSLTQTPTHNPDPMIGEFCKTVVETTKQGGNVLVPVYPAGTIYDLQECLAGQMDMNGLMNIPMFFVSPVADTSLAYSNITAEWLSTSKQNRVYLPEEPFIHANLTRSNRLKSFKNLYDNNFSHEYRQPCVMFCGHPSLRYGDAIHFIELWGNNSNNTIIFTEPNFPYLDALAPFQPLMMKAVFCPIDTSLNFNQAKKLIRDLKPGMLVVPEQYTTPPSNSPQRTDLVIESDSTLYTINRYECVDLPLDSKFEKIFIDPSLAAKINPVEVRPGVAVSSVIGHLSVTNNKYSLNAPLTENSSSRKRKHAGPSLPKALRFAPCNEHLYGRLVARDLLQKLGAFGIHDTKLDETSPGNFVIHLSQDDILIQVENYQAHVICNNEEGRTNEHVRKKIRDAIVSCLNKF